MRSFGTEETGNVRSRRQRKVENGPFLGRAKNRNPGAGGDVLSGFSQARRGGVDIGTARYKP